jgi:nicotinate-nucleotide adenylyltransferase
LRVGILGGAFNPPHIGHLVCAQEALVQLELEKVVFIPTGEPPHRQIEQDPGADARLRMCELAIEGNERFEISRVELDRPGPSYTSDTLRQLRQSRPDDELFLILGSDQAGNLSRWHEPEAVLELATVAVVERTGSHREGVSVRIASIKGARRVRFFNMPTVAVSSTLVRHRATEGKPIRYLVPEEVAVYIEQNGLYRTSAAVEAG